MSFAIFMKLTASVFIAPDASTMASCAASASNLFGAVLNGNPVTLEISSATLTSKPFLVFRPCSSASVSRRTPTSGGTDGADGGPALSEEA